MVAEMGKAFGADQPSDEPNPLGSGAEMMEAMMYGMPIKSLASFSGGAIDLDGLIATLNQFANA